MSGRDEEEAVDLIYAAAMGAASWREAIAAVTDFVGVDGAALQSPGMVRQGAGFDYDARFDIFLTRNIDEELADQTSQRVTRRELEEPFSMKMLESLQGDWSRVAAISRVASRDEVHATPFWHEHMLPLGQQDVAGIILSKGELGHVPVLSVFKSLSAPEAFTQDELDRFQALGPHLQRATRLMRLTPPRGARLQQSLHALDHVDLPCIVLDSWGRVALLNAAAEGLLSAWPIFRIRGQALECVALSLSRRFAALVRGALTDRPRSGGELLIPGTDAMPAVAVVVAPMGGENPFMDGGPRRAAVYFLVSARSFRTGAERVARMLELTPAETAVLIGLAAGQSPAEMAEARQTSVHTVRTQLKHILSKADVQRTGALLAMCSAFDMVRDP